jgi:hypothetical protein
MKTKRKKPARGGDNLRNVVVLRGSPEFAEWLRTMSRETLIPQASIVRAGLRAWAEANNHTPPPEI